MSEPLCGCQGICKNTAHGDTEAHLTRKACGYPALFQLAQRLAGILDDIKFYRLNFIGLYLLEARLDDALLELRAKGLLK